MSASSAADRVRRPVVPWGALGLDLVLVLVFALIGRASHAEGLGLAGLVVTAAPFLAGTVAGWALLLAWPAAPRPASLGGGALVWASTLVLGMALRALTGLGVQISFVLVAASFTALMLIGWRALGVYVVRRSAR